MGKKTFNLEFYISIFTTVDQVKSEVCTCISVQITIKMPRHFTQNKIITRIINSTIDNSVIYNSVC